MAVVSQGKSEFAQRIQRIEKRGAGVSEVFNADAIRGSSRARRHIRRANHASGGWLWKLPLALILGALAFVAAQYATFRINALPELPAEVSAALANPDYILLGQSVLALSLVFFARLFLHLTTKTQLVLSVLGMVAAMSMMHNLVHMAPEPWAEIFSPGWVNELRAHTAPGTLYFRGQSIPLNQLSLG